MNYHCIFLLLLVVLSACSESLQHADLPDPPSIGVNVYLVEWAIATHDMYRSPVVLVMFIFYVVFNWKILVIYTCHTNNRFLSQYLARCVWRIWLCGLWKIDSNCEMEDLSEVESINLLKVDGVIRKARFKTSDSVTELKGPVLAFHCNKMCPVCVDSLDKKNMPTLALTHGLWIGDISAELQDLTYAVGVDFPWTMQPDSSNTSWEVSAQKSVICMTCTHH